MLTAMQSRLARTVLPLRANQYDAVAHARQRFNILLAIALFKLFNFFGGTWDIQWHIEIGRDSLWIPPHLMVVVAFLSGSLIVLSAIGYETYLARSGVKLGRVVRFGPLYAPLAFFGVLFGYSGALLSGGFDELWHRTFGIDATLWSPPHLFIMAATMLVDLSLLVGLAEAARRLGWKFHLRSPWLWGLSLAGAYAFEAVNFQMSEAFIVGYRAEGVGLMGLLFPILIGAVFPLPLLLSIRLSGRFWIAPLIFGIAILLQYTGTGIAAIGFAILKPVSVINEFVLLNPWSTTAKARQFAQLIGFNGLIGFQQAWAMALSALPLVLVSLLQLSARARRRPLLAAPLYSASVVILSYLWFQQLPLLKSYGNTWGDAALGAVLSAAGGWITGAAGLRLASLVKETGDGGREAGET